jgi:hypothetical protein
MMKPTSSIVVCHAQDLGTAGAGPHPCLNHNPSLAGEGNQVAIGTPTPHTIIPNSSVLTPITYSLKTPIFASPKKAL